MIKILCRGKQISQGPQLSEVYTPTELKIRCWLTIKHLLVAKAGSLEALNYPSCCGTELQPSCSLRKVGQINGKLHGVSVGCNPWWRVHRTKNQASVCSSQSQRKQELKIEILREGCGVRWITLGTFRIAVGSSWNWVFGCGEKARFFLM